MILKMMTAVVCVRQGLNYYTCIVSVLKLLNVFLHVHFFFQQHFILFLALLNSSRASIYCKVSVLSKLF